MTDFTERRQRVTDTDDILLLLEVTADSFTGPLYLAADTQDWESNGVTYVGAPFGFKLPDDTAGQSPRAQLVMANAGRGVSEELERLGPNETPIATLRVTDKSDPDTIFQTYILPITVVSASGAQVTAQCGVDFLMRQQAVRLRANGQTVARPA